MTRFFWSKLNSFEIYFDAIFCQFYTTKFCIQHIFQIFSSLSLLFSPFQFFVISFPYQPFSQLHHYFKQIHFHSYTHSALSVKFSRLYTFLRVIQLKRSGNTSNYGSAGPQLLLRFGVKVASLAPLRVFCAVLDYCGAAGPVLLSYVRECLQPWTCSPQVQFCLHAFSVDMTTCAYMTTLLKKDPA